MLRHPASLTISYPLLFAYIKNKCYLCITKKIGAGTTEAKILESPISNQVCTRCLMNVGDLFIGMALKNQLGYTTESFIAKAREVHGDKYDYSLAKYTGAFGKVSIICPEHGLFTMPASRHLCGGGCQKCAVRKSIADVLNEFKKVHGDFYDYSLVPDEYVDSKKPVTIICPNHGKFKMTPYYHAKGGRCRKCVSQDIRNRHFVYGVGINDVDEKTRTTCYRIWKSILGRCYSKHCQTKNPTYKGCSVCPEWLKYSNFKTWFDNNYIAGYDIDKDILYRGNKEYSPLKCRFVPHEINSLLLNCKKNRGKYPLGVCKIGNFFYANMRKYGEYVKVGKYDNPEEAFNAYKQSKESYIKEVATAYYNEGKIGYDIYLALMNWEIKITD